LTRVTKEDAWQVLQTACTKDKAISRSSAVRALGLITSNTRARKLAEEALVDNVPEIRLAAADALGEMNARTSIPKLRRALNDSDPTVALAAAHSLQLMHNRSAYQVYYEVLAGDRKTHKGLIASQIAALKDPKKIAKLGITGSMSFVPYGGLGWTAVNVIAKDDTSPVRAAAARALVDDPDPAAMKVLTDAAGDKSWLVRAAVLEALAKRGNPASLDTVQLYVYDEKDVVRYTAAAAVLRLTAIREANAKK
jgi:HEAT repeat protein